MRRPQGYAVLSAPERIVECDTFTCGHCQHIIHIPPRSNPEDLGGLCKVCMRLICPACLPKGCMPFEEKLKKMEARGRALRSYGL